MLNRIQNKGWSGTLLLALALSAPAVLGQELLVPSSSLWETEPGGGFKKGAQELDLALGGGKGVAVFGGKHEHDWALASIQYGYVFTDVVFRDHWFRGNWEFLGQIFGGEQFRPDTAYLAGISPLLRYNFASGGRFMPFVTAGAGIVATDIRNDDLGSTFEFGLQAGAGVHYFLRRNTALTLEYRFVHISNAGMDSPNCGVNNNTLLLGLSWFF